MIFNSIEFALFLPLVLGIYWALRARLRRQNLLLLVASYVFYGWWDWRFLSLIVVSTIVDFTVANRMATTDAESARKRLLAVSLAVNLGILATFKYFGFFVDSAANMLSAFGLQPNRVSLEVLLPVGISFYTFQTISYTFDVFRRRIEPTRSLLDFGVYVAYFPQLVAGPIERARKLLPQIARPRDLPTWDRVRGAGMLILLGLFKKVAIADVMAGFAQAAFDNAGTASVGTLLIGVYAFSLQIYGDFSGYTDIARGTSRLFGIELMENFNQPYLSRNITQFWRTWHISLSNWLNDYLYVPLGGNRSGRLATYRNLMLTMLLGGLWHGAAWTFVVWGALHGIFLSVHRAIGDYVSRGYQGKFGLRDLAPTVVTFHLVSFAWIFFRAESFTEAFEYVGGIVTMRGGGVSEPDLLVVIVAALAVFAIDIAQRNGADELAPLRWHPTARGLAYGFAVLAIIVMSGGQVQPFIYFQF